MIKVAKFGGSSLANARQFKKVAAIIHKDNSIHYVIPSAPGKRFDDDIKVTDMLIACYQKANQNKDFSKDLQQIKNRYQEIIDNLHLTISLDSDFIDIKTTLQSNPTLDYAASRGEYLNGKIMASYLGFDFLDPKDCILFDETDHLLMDETIKKLQEVLVSKNKKTVIPGFFGSNREGEIKTFSRGGSDITGSLIANAVNADLYENWTDVSGFLVTNPSIVPNAKTIEIITYNELRELSYMGANVIHEEAIFPVRKDGITINIKNTNAPHDKGTLIMKETDRLPTYVITGIAGKKHFVAINIQKDLMNNEIGFGRKVLEVFEKNSISFEHAPTSIDSMSVYVHRSEFDEKHEKVVKELQETVHPDDIEVVGDLALIAIVGRQIRTNKGIASRIFQTLDNHDINIKMINHGASELNIIIGVKNNDFSSAIKAIYDEFID